MKAIPELPRRVLVTGGAGFIGSHAAVELSARGHQIAIADNYHNSSREMVSRLSKLVASPLRCFEVDIRSESSLTKVFKEFRPEVVFHFAALKSASESCRDPISYFDNNIAGTITLMKVMLACETYKLVFSSSATVYGACAELPIGEDAATGPITPYGHSKLIMEHLIQEVGRAHPAFRSVILRYFNPVGAHPSGLIGESPLGVPDNLVPYVAQVAAGVLPRLRVFGSDYPTPDGTGVRDYVHVSDLARAHADALDYLHRGDPPSLTANLGTGRGYSVLEVIRAFERASGRAITYDIVARRPGDAASSYADPSIAWRTLGWRALHDLDRMCEDAWRWQMQGGQDNPT